MVPGDLAADAEAAGVEGLLARPRCTSSQMPTSSACIWSATAMLRRR